MVNKKVGPTDFRKEAEKMLREGTMPSLDEVLHAVADVRQEFVPKITEARKKSLSLT
jgi:hypothetical protein